LADQQDDWKTAVELYSLALKLDHELATAYIGRGNNYVRINNIKAARADFEEAIKLDPSDSLPISGLALVMVMQGDIVKGIEFVEELKKKFKTEFLFSYNLACVYGRAVEYIKRRKDFPNRETHLKKYRDKAIVELKLAVERGFRDLDWMKRDPDLKSLQDLPQFKRIHSPTATDADPQKPAK
jgi:tetratricopeptide (TPR) repeat protein